MSSSLLRSALAYNLDAHRANPANLAAGALGMIVNNCIFLAGIWAMLFAAKPENEHLLPYYIGLTAIVMVSWGFVNFFFGGLQWLGDLITEGALEPMLATPRDPIFLAGISKSSATALGDLAMGLVGIGFLAWKFGAAVGFANLAAAAISTLGFAALFILAGSVSFFVPRGSEIGRILIEITISLSSYPTGKMFSGGMGRILLLLTPAAATAVLPMEAVESLGARDFIIAGGAAVVFFLLSVGVFRLGVRRYRSISLVAARN